MNAHIYTLTDPTTGDIRYIGRTDNPERRWKAYQRGQRSKRIAAWFDALESIGEYPEFGIIETCDYYKARERELYWINRYKVTGLLLNKAGVDQAYGPLDDEYHARQQRKFRKVMEFKRELAKYINR